MASQRRRLSRNEGIELYPRGPDELLLICPYDAAHVIPSSGFATHLSFCRKMHCAEQEEKKEKPLFSICKHDSTHHVRNDDLEDHERACRWNRTLNAMYGQGTYEVDGVTHGPGAGSSRERRRNMHGYACDSETESPGT